MTKIKDLINFEEIKDVIDIDSDLETKEGRRELVEEFIISQNLQEYLVNLAEEFSQEVHKSQIIIGDYGSGKSHLMGWILSLLENQELAKYISEENVKQKFEDHLDRDFAVVQFELQPGEPPLSQFFIDRLEMQLDEKYDIKAPPLENPETPDFKKYIKNVVKKIKQENPEMGLVVAIDEISDFLRQKSKTESERDNQFLRILGQVSQSTDFMFIGSMQENVFSSPKFRDDAESYGRVRERFHQITISQKDIKRVISTRILNKNDRQRDKIYELLEDYRMEFEPIKSNPDEYLDLFPVHPYVIEIFNSLEYFEKRGVIQFITEEIKKILNKDFPKFITFDKIFDKVENAHNIKNLDEVIPVVEKVNVLRDKIELMKDDDQEDIEKIINGLGVLKLYGKTEKTGAGPEELANKLLIRSEKYENEDRVNLVLKRLREKTFGQHLGKTEDNYYYIDLKEGIDIDEKIKRKTRNLPEGAENEELISILNYSDLIDSFESVERYERVFLDSCNWPSKKSFRLGHFVYDDGTDYVEEGNKEYNLILVSPYTNEPTIKSEKTTALLDMEYEDEMDELLKKCAATRSLIQEDFKRNALRKKRSKFKDQAKEIILSKLLDSSIEIDSKERNIKGILTREPDSIDEFFHYLKEKIFDEVFSEKYSKYPKMASQISYHNIESEINTAINQIIGEEDTTFISNTENILSSLDLIDMEGKIDTSDSIYAEYILDQLKEKEGKNVGIDDILENLKNEPFGLQNELTHLVLVVLTYNGEILLKKKGGKVITSADLSDIFDKGLKAFEVIRYAMKETDFPVQDTISLFKALDLNPGLIRQEKTRAEGVKAFKEKTLEIKEKLEEVSEKKDLIINRPDPFIDVEGLENKLSLVKEIPIEKMEKISSVNDFKNVEFSEEELSDIKEGVGLLERLRGLLNDYYDYINKDFSYVLESIEFIEKYQDIFSEDKIDELNKIRVECENIFNDISELLKRNKRRELKGKLEQYKRKYKSYYHDRHANSIGQGVDWYKLDEINQSEELKQLRNMETINCINSLELKNIVEKLRSISEAQCTKLLEDHLDDNYKCPWCSFPEEVDKIKDFDETIDWIHDRIGEIKEEWTENILKEIEKYEENIELLSEEKKEIIDEIRDKQELPEKIDQETIKALNQLFSDLREVKISAKDIEDHIFDERAILDYETFSEKLEKLKERILEKGENKRKDIRVIKGEE